MYDRQRISTAWLGALLGVALLPLLAVNLRLSALASPDPSGLVRLGDWLNQTFSLNWVGAEDRSVALYILLLPLAALLTALTRLTLGVRVLGFRAILIAIGFQEIGLVPSLLLILLIASTVVVVRPAMRRSGMPLYARVAVILCIVALTMVFGLLIGAWLESSTLWSMAFFPVVILAMLAESVADTVARDNITMAVWRTAATITLAIVIAGLSQITSIRELALACPELLITQLVLIVFVSEFLDLRLFEGFRPGTKAPAAATNRASVVLVRNRFGDAPIERTGPETPRRYRRATLQPLIDELRSRGFGVQVLEGDSSLPRKLRAAATQGSRASRPEVIVMNGAGGTHGAGRLAQVPMISEMLGLAYTGPEPQAPVLLDDRVRQMRALSEAGLPIPRTLSLQNAQDYLQDPLQDSLQSEGRRLWVRPRYQADRDATAVRDPRQLRRVVERTGQRFGEVMLERIPAGRAVTAIVLAPDEQEHTRVLPLVEKHRGRSQFQAAGEYPALCMTAIHEAAIGAARALACRDIARVDLFCTGDGQITVAQVLGIEPMSKTSATGKAARLAGMSLGDLGESLIQAAARRAQRTAWRCLSPQQFPSPSQSPRQSPLQSSSNTGSTSEQSAGNSERASGLN